MTRGDQALDTAADSLETFVQNAEREGGVKAKVGHAFADDPEFLRKLKPSLIKARAKGKPKSGGPNPWLVVGAAFALGMLAAKALDWRGHAHPRW